MLIGEAQVHCSVSMCQSFYCVNHIINKIIVTYFKPVTKKSEQFVIEYGYLPLKYFNIFIHWNKKKRTKKHEKILDRIANVRVVVSVSAMFGASAPA